jgi:hypothetical protein
MTSSWYDLMVAEEETQMDQRVLMTESEWKEEAKRIVRSWTGDLRTCINYLDDMDARRTAVASGSTAQPAVPLTEDELNWRVWKDMMAEPWKYGADIGEWMELDAKVRAGPKRWRADAVWWEIVREIEEEESSAAAKIQAAWRGHQSRYATAPRFNCSRCLAHEVCWVACEDREHWLCEPCAKEWAVALRVLGEELEYEEELAEYEARVQEDMDQDLSDEVCADCGDDIVQYAATVGGEWFCAACIHDWTECQREGCGRPMRTEGRCWNHCSECGDDLAGLGQTNGFCSSDCRTAYLRDS